MTGTAITSTEGLTVIERGRLAVHLASGGSEVEGRLEVRLIAGGRSNLTYRLTDDRSDWVLRMPPRTGRTPSAHDVAREYRVTQALHDTDVPVAAAIAAGDDELLGGPFAIYDFVDGVAIQVAEDLEALDEHTLRRTVRELMTVLAALHRVDPVAVGLESLGRPDGYAARQLKRWAGQWDLVGAAEGPVARIAAQVMAELGNRVPGQPSSAIIHGDYRIDNTLLQFTVEPTVAAVVDWELSTLGDPVADLAMTCAYRHPAFDQIVGGHAAWTSPRIPTIEDLLTDYEAAGGALVTNWAFHLALAYYKVAVIAAGIDHRYQSGSGSGAGFDTARLAVSQFLEASLTALRGPE